MKNTSKLVTTLCEIGIFAALGFVLDELQGIIFKGVFPNGGSIGFAMIAVLIIAFRRRNVWPAVLTGLIIGLLDIATSAYIIHPVQLLLDYVFPYTVVGFAGIFKIFFDKSETKGAKILWLIVGAVVGGMFKFLSHYLAGVFFWADPSAFAWGLGSMSAPLYCFVYNIAFIGPSIVLTGALLVLLYIRAPQVFVPKYDATDESLKNVINPFKIILTGGTIAFGLFVFIFYLIKYINSYKSYVDGDAFGYDFDPDSMVIFVLGFFLAIMGVNNLVKYFKDRFSYVSYSAALSGILLVSMIYDIARLIRMYVKGKDPTLYWIWFVIGLLSLGGALTFFIISFIKRKREKQLESNI